MSERKTIKTSVQSGKLFNDIVGGGGGCTRLIMQSVMFNHYNQLSTNVTKHLESSSLKKMYEQPNG